MLQDIFPHKLDISFRQPNPQNDDLVLAFDNDKVLLQTGPADPVIPVYQSLSASYPNIVENVSFLFSIDEINVFLTHEALPPMDDFAYHSVQIFREFQPSWLGFTAITANHLAIWQAKNRYCGRCASATSPSQTERAMVCQACGNIIYPCIAPVVIVGLTDGDRLMMTRYAQGNYKNLALIAGFAEIGETLEDAVRREVKEEVGLEVKNIRYYKSQPWAFSQSVLAGFFADLDGPEQITLDKNELSEALWVPRNQIPENKSSISLTFEMVEAFRCHSFPL